MAGRWALLAAVVLLLLGAARAKRVPWWSIRIAQQQGPHACAVEEVPGTYTELWTECRYWTHREICGQRTLIRYECCEGYQQLGEKGDCTAVKPLKDLLDTAADLGASRFVSVIREAGLADELGADGTYTLFAPADSAFERMPASLRAALESDGTRNAVLLYHLLDGRLTSREMKADQLVETRSRGARLRLNTYSNQMRTANCHLLKRKDQKATNGIVHIIDGVLDPSRISDLSMVDLIAQDGRFSLLTGALQQSGLAGELQDLPRAVTLLAPSDEAFQKLPERRRQAMFGDQAALRALIDNHIIKHPICKAAILGEHKMKSKAGNKLTFQCEVDKVFVERSEAKSDEILTEDGVIHVLDDVIIPERAMSLLELARQQELDTFLRLVSEAGLEETLQDSEDMTLFVPSEEALRAMPESLRESVRSDQAAAKQLLLYHGTKGRYLSKDIADGQTVPSLDGENVLRLQVHRRALGVEDALVRRADLEARNGVLHVIDRLLQPVTTSAGDILRQRGGFSTFLEWMEKVMMADGSDLALHTRGACTFFVPTDAAFGALGQRAADQLAGDVDTLTMIIKNHISERMLPAGAFQPDLTYHVTTKQGTVDVRRAAGDITVGNARVLEKDILNTNGIIHVIDQVLLPSVVQETHFKSEKSETHSIHRTSSVRRTYGSFSRRVTTSSSRSERRLRRRGSARTRLSDTARRGPTVG